MVLNIDAGAHSYSDTVAIYSNTKLPLWLSIVY